MKNLTSTIIIVQEGKWFVAKSSELGVASQGRTIEEAKNNIREAIELYLEDQPSEAKALYNSSPLVTTIDISRG